MITPDPKFALSASVAFTVVGKVLQLTPDSHKFSLRMTFPCGGQYQCLSLFADYYPKHLCDFNILSGRFHVFDPFDNADIAPAKAWPEERNYLLAFVSQEYSLDRIVEDVLTGLGVPKLNAANQYAGCMALAIGAVVGRFLYDPESLIVENGWASDERWAEWLESVPEDCMLSKPFTDNDVGRLWRLQFNNYSVLFNDELAYLTGTDAAFDVCTEMKAYGGSAASTATRIEQHLRGVAERHRTAVP